MNLSKRQHQIRLNPAEEALLRELLTEITSTHEERLTHLDRAGRNGYRNYSGAKPAAKSLILRRAIQLGLPQVISELNLDIAVSGPDPLLTP